MRLSLYLTLVGLVYISPHIDKIVALILGAVSLAAALLVNILENKSDSQ